MLRELGRRDEGDEADRPQPGWRSFLDSAREEPDLAPIATLLERARSAAAGEPVELHDAAEILAAAERAAELAGRWPSRSLA